MSVTVSPYKVDYTDTYADTFDITTEIDAIVSRLPNAYQASDMDTSFQLFYNTYQGLGGTAAIHIQSDSAKDIGLENLTDYLQNRPVIPQESSSMKERFQVLQKWEGYVIEVRRDSFLARLTPIKGDPDELEAEIYIEEVDESDQFLIQRGAIFYWSIGYLLKPSGRYRTSIIRFRRLPNWSKRELEAAQAEARRLKSLLDGE